MISRPLLSSPFRLGVLLFTHLLLAYASQSNRSAPFEIRRKPVKLSIFQYVFVALLFGEPFAERHRIKVIHLYDRMGRRLLKIGRFVVASCRTTERFVILDARFPNREAD